MGSYSSLKANLCASAEASVVAWLAWGMCPAGDCSGALYHGQRGSSTAIRRSISYARVAPVSSEDVEGAGEGDSRANSAAGEANGLLKETLCIHLGVLILVGNLDFDLVRGRAAAVLLVVEPDAYFLR